MQINTVFSIKKKRITSDPVRVWTRAQEVLFSDKRLLTRGV